MALLNLQQMALSTLIMRIFFKKTATEHKYECKIATTSPRMHELFLIVIHLGQIN